MPFLVSPPYKRTFSTQSSFGLRIKGTKKTSYLYMGDTVSPVLELRCFSKRTNPVFEWQWDPLSHSESRNTWLPMEIDDGKGTLEIVWHDVFDLNVLVYQEHHRRGISKSSPAKYSRHKLCTSGYSILIGWCNRKTGEWKPIKGKTYRAKDATTIGSAYLQEAVRSPLSMRPISLLTLPSTELCEANLLTS
jgi:hypothetical protein